MCLYPTYKCFKYDERDFSYNVSSSITKGNNLLVLIVREIKPRVYLGGILKRDFNDAITFFKYALSCISLVDFLRSL